MTFPFKIYILYLYNYRAGKILEYYLKHVFFFFAEINFLDLRQERNSVQKPFTTTHYEQECWDEPKEVCQVVYDSKVDVVPKQECSKQYKRECHNKPREECVDIQVCPEIIFIYFS